MELCELRVFLAVASERSFSRAAAKLYRTQPAVSQAIRRLEDQLGERLLDRTTKHATLTEAGAVLFREGTRLIRLAEETQAAVRRQSERGRAIVRIAGSEVAAHVMLPAISAFMRQHPGACVDFHPLEEAQVVTEVTAGAFDIGVVTQERIPAHLHQLRIPVQARGFSILVPRTHPLAARQGAGIHALHQERLIVVTDVDTGDRLEGAFADASVEPASVMRMPGLDSLTRAVDMGLGIGVVPASVASVLHRPRTLVALPLSSPSFWTFLTLVYRRNESLSGHPAQFVDIVRRSQQPSMSPGESTDARRTAARI